MIDLDKLEALAKSATPGLWERNRAFGLLNVQDAKYMLGDADAIFISAASPTTVLELIALVRELAVVSIPVIKEGAKIEGCAPVVLTYRTQALWDASERLAEIWDGCEGEDCKDIGASIRHDFKMFAEQAAAPAAPASELMRKALERIARWHGEFPATGKTWQDGTPTSYAAEYGSNGERDYMRQVALDALSATAPVVDAVPQTDQQLVSAAIATLRECRAEQFDLAILEAIPEGWKLVPIEPTDAMVLAPGAINTGGNVARIHREVWRRMLVAAPAHGAAS